MGLLVRVLTLPGFAQTAFRFLQLLSLICVVAVGFGRERDCILRIQIVLKERRRLRRQSKALLA